MNTATLNGATLNGTGDPPAALPLYGSPACVIALLLRRRAWPAPAPLVIAGWTCVPLPDDDDVFGVDPDQTVATN